GEVVGGDEHAEADDREDRSRGWAETARQLVGNRLGGDVEAAHVSPPTRTFAGGRIVNDSPYRPRSSTHRESEPSIVVANSARVTLSPTTSRIAAVDGPCLPCSSWETGSVETSEPLMCHPRR